MIFVDENNNVLDTFLQSGSSAILKEIKRIGNTYKDKKLVFAYYKTIYYKEGVYSEPELAAMIRPSLIQLHKGAEKIKSVNPFELNGNWSLSNDKILTGFEKNGRLGYLKSNCKMD